MKKIYHRNIKLESDDFQEMTAYLSDIYGKGNHTWTLGQLYGWKYGLWTPESRDPETFCKSAELFFDEEDNLLGFTVLGSCGGSKATIFVSENKQIYGEILEFLDKGGNFNKDYSIYCSENNLLELELLRSHKYTDVNYQDVTFEYCAEDIVLPVIELPKGYRLTDEEMFLNEDMLERFRFSAFNPGAVLTKELEYAYHYGRQNPFTKKKLSIVLLDENNSPISACMGNFDVDNLDVEIEVVCTKKEEEGKGYAKAVIAECIRRCVEIGARKVNISGWNEVTKHLYSSFGKHTTIQKLELRKKMDEVK